MKKILLLLTILFVLNSCGQKETDNTINTLEKATSIVNKPQTINNNIVVSPKKIIKSKKSIVITPEVSGTSSLIIPTITNNPISFADIEKQAKALEKDIENIYKIKNSPNAYNFWFKDCKKIFTQENGIRQCQTLSLKEITIGCDDKGNINGPGKVEIDKLFSLIKFDLLNKTEVLKNKTTCLEQRQKTKQQEIKNKQRNLSLEKANKEYTRKIKNYKLSDCKKTYKQGSLTEEIKKIEKNKNLASDIKKNIIRQLKQTFIDPIEKCEISFALNIKKDCNILEMNKQIKCKQAKKDIEMLIQMQKSIINYNIFDTSIIRKEIYKKNGLENNLNLPSGFNQNNRGGQDNRPVNFPGISQTIR